VHPFHAPTADTQRRIISRLLAFQSRLNHADGRFCIVAERFPRSAPARFDLVGGQNGSYSGRAEGARRTLMNPDFASSVRTPRDNARGVESLLWLAAGAAWAIVALKAWSQSQKTKARHRTFSTSERLLTQVFPNGIRP
jgi:hypothetical protein